MSSIPRSLLTACGLSLPIALGTGFVYLDNNLRRTEESYDRVIAEKIAEIPKSAQGTIPMSLEEENWLWAKTKGEKWLREGLGIKVETDRNIALKQEKEAMIRGTKFAALEAKVVYGSLKSLKENLDWLSQNHLDAKNRLNELLKSETYEDLEILRDTDLEELESKILKYAQSVREQFSVLNPHEEYKPSTEELSIYADYTSALEELKHMTSAWQLYSKK